MGVIPRKVTKDYNVPNTQLVMHKGMQIIIPIMAIHMDPEYYPDPEKFDPSRFEKEQVLQRPTCAYMPFGEGPRICPGLRFGKMQAKVGLVALLTHFKFSMTDKTPDVIEFDVKYGILAPKDGIFLKIERRER